MTSLAKRLFWDALDPQTFRFTNTARAAFFYCHKASVAVSLKIVGTLVGIIFKRRELSYGPALPFEFCNVKQQLGRYEVSNLSFKSFVTDSLSLKTFKI